MLLLQVSIGALNDALDARVDAAEKPRKPIPAGVATRSLAFAVAGVAAVAGLLLSAPSGLPTLAVAAAGLGLGWIYDAGLSRTRLAWLPLALALPLVPVHAWLGATAGLPPGLVVLVPVALLAGAALALANGVVDLEQDRGAGLGGIVVALGRGPALVVNAGLMGLVVGAGLFLAPAVRLDDVRGEGTLPPESLDLLRSVALAGGVVLVGLGVALLAHRRPAVRERGWELQACGVLAIGVAWLAGTASGPSALLV